MRYVKVPLDVTIQLTPEARRQLDAARAAGQQVPEPVLEVYTFKRFALTVWLEDTRAFTEGDRYSLLLQRRWGKVIDKVEACREGDVLALDDEDWKRLTTIVSAPGVTMAPSVMRQLFVFADAVLEATETPPEPAPAN